LRIGYELVRHEELSYLGEQNRVQSGEFAGCVSINELILAKIPVELYQEIMLINHHEKPMQEEELLRANMESDETDSNGRPLGETFGEGIQNLAKRTVRRPAFE
jgi:glycine cleavage system pyridoxal-binding protein P